MPLSGFSSFEARFPAKVAKEEEKFQTVPDRERERERGLQSTELSPTSLIQKKRPFTGPGWNWENVL